MKTIIRLRNVRKSYALDKVRVEALHGVDLSIERGEFVSIMGASGSGKSTMLHLIGALDTPTSGTVHVDGVDIASLSAAKLARLRGSRIGFVFQFFNLYPTLTALENVELPMMISEISRKERSERARSLLERVGLSSRLHHYPSQLSGGERQRIAIARALANEPALLLADEPTGNLDSHTSAGIMQLFAELNDEGKTIVMVTHEDDIAEYSQRTVHVRDGRIVKK